MTQSMAIMRHVGRKFNLVGATEVESARADMICDQMMDFKAEWSALIGPVQSRYCPLIGGHLDMLKPNNGMLRCPSAIKTQRKTTNSLIRGFGYLELCLYGRRELASAPSEPRTWSSPSAVRAVWLTWSTMAGSVTNWSKTGWRGRGTLLPGEVFRRDLLLLKGWENT